MYTHADSERFQSVLCYNCAALDTVDHHLLENWVRLFGIDLRLFRLYLEVRGVVVATGDRESEQIKQASPRVQFLRLKFSRIAKNEEKTLTC